MEELAPPLHCAVDEILSVLLTKEPFATEERRATLRELCRRAVAACLCTALNPTQASEQVINRITEILEARPTDSAESVLIGISMGSTLYRNT